ncbi:hypothetical protein NBRC111894_4271 [Sporolactobacillus inulinus]|uniref:Uncharacterized protein n=1 Tax=Sporolactobacillus inulinus TaxID=2078 RepID=A0A4Y1ZHV6_9BACL|nr:hypothetical protein [Sporolactobacillus inulinus]GAY78717.1 hypothetical protein NBRC111894_4271 [Sporolactobacillus inulinus]
MKKATDAVFGAGTSASQELYTVIIQKGSLVDFPAFTKTIGGHTISFDQEGGVYVVIH